MAAPKLTPVLSVADGRVGQIRHEIGTEDCCRLVVEHDDGSERWYLHLNNDSSENRQRNRGILQACHHPLDPDHVLTRSEAVDRIAWWVLGIEPDPCPPPDQPVR